MKILKVEFLKLFGIFDHSINLDQKGGITIIIGENGLGKTVILEAINALFNRNYIFFNKLSFDKFNITFDSNETWSFRKGKSRSNSENLFLTRGKDGKNENKEYEIKTSIPSESSKRELIKREYLRRQYLMRQGHLIANLGDSSFLNDDSINQQLLEDRLLNEKINLYYSMFNDKPSKNHIWFEEIIDCINVKLIETQRIISHKDINSETFLNPVEYYSKQLREMITSAVKESSEVASKLDSTYPNRLISELKQGENNSFEDLNKALSKLNDRRKLLSSVGLITDSKDNDLLQIGQEQEQEDLIKVLKIYIDDSHKKLAPFEAISLKIKTFKEIINTRFKHKKLEVTQNDGITFKSTIIKDKKDHGVIIPSSGLSSGEQNELILFYKLIFNSQKNDLILIDEPELSLHISWQNKFIEDIKDIISINELSVVIATHSPDIISNNWNLMVELKGVE